MAGDWIKMRIDLQSHPKVVRILSATGTDNFRVIGGLHAVWGVFDTHSEDGVLHGYTPETLDHVVGWDGFAAAMCAVEWLMFDGRETLTLPEFAAHNGQSAKRRGEDQKRKRGSRKSVRNLSAIRPQTMRTESGLEKRREEKKIRNPLNPPSGGECDSEYPVEFEAAWAAYPKRDGGNSKKAAFKAWQARVRGGADAGELVAGTSRYAQHVRAEGKEGSRYVMQAATFFGPDDHYAEPWIAAEGEGDWLSRQMAQVLA